MFTVKITSDAYLYFFLNVHICFKILVHKYYTFYSKFNFEIRLK